MDSYDYITRKGFESYKFITNFHYHQKDYYRNIIWCDKTEKRYSEDTKRQKNPSGVYYDPNNF